MKVINFILSLIFKVRKSYLFSKYGEPEHETYTVHPQSDIGGEKAMIYKGRRMLWQFESFEGDWGEYIFWMGFTITRGEDGYSLRPTRSNLCMIGLHRSSTYLEDAGSVHYFYPIELQFHGFVLEHLKNPNLLIKRTPNQCWIIHILGFRWTIGLGEEFKSMRRIITNK